MKKHHKIQARKRVDAALSQKEENNYSQSDDLSRQLISFEKEFAESESENKDTTEGLINQSLFTEEFI